MALFSEKLANDIQEICGIDTSELIRVGLLHPNEARKWIVKKKYYLLAESGRAFTDIKLELSETYGISISSIEKLIYRKT
ncbi:MAG: hypothetical protein Q8T08_23660 [Ignavibacteria bacterium]|nr:hypothetical protein [Ignavibacteria bacterium]